MNNQEFGFIQPQIARRNLSRSESVPIPETLNTDVDDSYAHLLKKVADCEVGIAKILSLLQSIQLTASHPTPAPEPEPEPELEPEPEPEPEHTLHRKNNQVQSKTDIPPQNDTLTSEQKQELSQIIG